MILFALTAFERRPLEKNKKPFHPAIFNLSMNFAMESSHSWESLRILVLHSHSDICSAKYQQNKILITIYYS